MSNIDTNKLQTYLTTLDFKESEYVNKIIDHTIFIPTEQMIKMVRNSLHKFKESNQKYNIFVPKNKIGSEHYILLHLRDELNPIKVIYGYDQVINNDYPILLFDDAIYTSNNVCNHIDNIRDKIKNKFFICVAVLSRLNVQVVKDDYFNAEIIVDMTLEHLLPSNLFNDYDYDYFYNHFGCETNVILPLFFEHKIANAFGSYQFYHKLVDKPVSRKQIDKITKIDVENFVMSF